MSKDPVFVFCALRVLAAGGGVLASSSVGKKILIWKTKPTVLVYKLQTSQNCLTEVRKPMKNKQLIKTISVKMQMSTEYTLCINNNL